MSVSAVNPATIPPAAKAVEQVERGPDHDGDGDDAGTKTPAVQTAAIPNTGVFADTKV